MSRESLIFFFGIIVFITPYIGVPDTWKTYAYTLSGIIFMIAGYSLRHSAYVRSIENENGERDAESFAENQGSRNTPAESEDNI